MCIDGVNHAQLKLSLSQALQLAELCQKNVSQWKEALEQVDSPALAEYLEEAESHFAQSLALLKKALEEADRLVSHHHDDSVTITKL